MPPTGRPNAERTISTMSWWCWWTGIMCCDATSHSKQETTFVHPVTQESAVRAEAIQSPPLRPLFPRVEAQPKAIISSTPTMELKKPQHQRKKSSGSIRSPLVKRDHQTQVILKGWLYRLEGGALKQWKKRWVVLADFCLFYYKNDGEDRLLGSILLPSYTINVCCSNDHISRRFAFKAEHQNMKTYYFAADSKESCIKWMNAMSLASIMQKDLYPFSSGYPPTDQHRRSSPAVMHDEEDSGFTSYRSRRGRNHDPNSTLNSSFGSSRGPHSSVGSNGYLGSDEKYPLQYLECPRKPGGQPLYANAPPKPKRVGPKDAYQCTSPYDNYDPSAVQPDHYRVPQTLYAVPNPHEEDPNWPAGINYQDNFVYGSGYYPMAERKDRMFASKSQQQQQPQRPHSAEFLDRETYDGGGDIPIASHRPRTPRQRPKSSLEQYDPQQYYWGSHSDTAPQRSPGYLNAQSAYEWSSPDRRMHPELVYQMRLRQQQEVRSLSRPEMSGFVDPEQKKAQLREESLKRLLEWKQRMLQSPLSRKSGSPQHQQQRRHSDLPPARPPLPEEYRQKVLRDLENHEARLRMYETQFRSQVYDEENVPPPAPTAATQNVRHDDAPTVYRERSRSASGKREVVEIVRNGWPPQHPMHSAANAQEQRKSSKSLNFLNNSYSSDDESSVQDWKSRKHVLRKKTLQARDGINVSDSEIHKQTSVKVRRLIQKSHGLSRHGKRLSISAGDLLEKSHEELVLLLIQLRRSQARMLKTKERCRVQLESMQKITKMDAAATEQAQTYEELRTQMEELDKQQKYTSPLINLVDNMVKLGSLYRGSDKRSLSEPTLDMNRLEPYSPSQSMLDFTNQLQKQLIAHQDSKDDDFKERIERLYELNVILQEESANLAALHQDKDMLEMTLDSVRCKISDVHDNSLTIQKLQKQQQMLERELGRVRNLLAQSAQRMEETAAENAKLEQDILMLREKIQQALRITGSPGKDTSAQVRADLEMELSKVQNVIEDLARRRHELSNAVETLRSESRYRSAVAHVRASPTGVAGSAPLPIRRRQLSTYLETDLDSLDSRDLASVPRHIYFTDEESPLYVNATDITPDEETADTSTDDVLEPALLTSELQAQVLAELYLPQDINEADERMKKFYGILPRDKPAEIKTVRIVKRESERRNKGRTEKKRVTYDDQSLVWLVEEPDFCLSDDKEDEEEYDERDTEGNQSLDSSLYKRPTTLLFPGGHYQQHVYPSAHEQLFGLASAHVISPSSSSSSNQKSPNDYRSPFKKAKRRHYTISGSQPYTEQIYTKVSGPRSRDDMDMERCLRTVNTPDIVRSTIKKTDVFDDKIIDRELGTPQKILIPERYIEDEPENLSVQEQLQRSLKAENIRKMLSETTTYGDIGDKSHKDLLQKKLNEEKRKRAHLLALNHALAKEVMERSKMVAANLSSLDPPPNSP